MAAAPGALPGTGPRRRPHRGLRAPGSGRGFPHRAALPSPGSFRSAKRTQRPEARVKDTKPGAPGTARLIPGSFFYFIGGGFSAGTGSRRAPPHPRQPPGPQTPRRGREDAPRGCSGPKRGVSPRAPRSPSPSRCSPPAALTPLTCCAARPRLLRGSCAAALPPPPAAAAPPGPAGRALPAAPRPPAPAPAAPDRPSVPGMLGGSRLAASPGAWGWGKGSSIPPLTGQRPDLLAGSVPGSYRKHALVLWGHIPPSWRGGILRLPGQQPSPSSPSIPSSPPRSGRTAGDAQTANYTRGQGPPSA